MPKTSRLFVLLVAVASLSSTALSAQAQAQEQGTGKSEVTTERFKDWALRCRSQGEGGSRQCSIFQRLIVEETKQLALNVAIGYGTDTEGKRMPIAIFTFPLGIFLPAGAVLKVDDGESARMPIERCFDRGCQCALVLEQKWIERFKAGSTASVTIRQERDEEIPLTVSLSGFSAAFNALGAPEN